jgi:twinkle protein
MDISGSGDITNGADNVLSVWRNKAKERKRESGELTDVDDMTTPDSICYQQKARWAGDEHTVPLWFTKSRRKFVTRSKITGPNGQPIPLVPNLTTYIERERPE